MSRDSSVDELPGSMPAAIARIFREALTCRTELDLGRACLTVAEEITRSRFGFIGEINRQTRKLDAIVISGAGWDACAMTDSAGAERRPLISLEIHGLYGRVLLDSRSLLTNDPASHPDRIGTPPGHPPLQSFLGVPLVQAGETIGMLGLGNREGGYGPSELALAEGIAPAIVQAFVSKRAEIALRNSEQRLRLALGAAYVISFEWDIQRDRVWRDVSVEPALAPTARDAPGTFADVCAAIHPEDLARFKANVAAALESRDGRYRSEHRLLTPDGRVVWLHELGRVNRDAKGRPARLIGLSQDITTRKAAEAEREGLLAERNAVMEGTDVLLALLDPAFDFVWVNPAYAESARMQPQEMIGKNHFALYPHAENETIFRYVRDTGQGVFFKDKPFEYPDQPERGVTYWDWSLKPVKAADGALTGLVYSLRETTRYVRAEEALATSEGRYRELVDNANSAIIRWNRHGILTYFNPYAERLFGWTAAEAIGRHVGILVPDEDSTGQDMGDLVNAIVRFPEAYTSNINQNVCRNGRRVWINWTNRAMVDAKGQVTEVLAIGNDITAQKQAEEALHEADRRKDEFLATLAHELRNPLVPLRNAAAILKMAAITDPTVQTARGMIERQIEHMVRLIDDLLDVSRITSGKLQLRPEQVDLAAVLDRAVEAVQPLIDKAQLSVSVPPAPVILTADPVRLTQVFSNLLANACACTPAGGQIEVSVDFDGNDARVGIRDTGIGIPAEHLPRVFDMFHQVPADVDSVQSGLGIGLSIVRGIVALHGGRVEAQSEGAGKGSTFRVWLPMEARNAVGELAQATMPEDRAAKAARVLVVDDKEDAVESLAMLLRLQGSEVETARDGLEALAAAERFRPDIVLLDLGMPKLDGYETCKRMRAAPWGKDLAIVAVTGWGQESDRRNTEAAGFDGHLVKPVEPAALLRLLATNRPGGHSGALPGAP